MEEKLIMDKYISSDKLYYYQERFEKLTNPVSAEIIMTNFCNYNCDYCRYKRGKGYINYSNFKNAVMRLVKMGVKGLILTGGGEPVLNPDIDKALSWLDEKGIPYGINTNFTRQINNEPDWIKVSLHDNYDTKNVLKNIEEYRGRKNKTTLGIQKIVLKEHEIEAFYSKYKNLDVDYIVFRPLELQEKMYDDETIKNIVSHIEDLKKQNDKVIINYKWYMMDKVFSECTANWSVITVDYNCDVWYCCHKPQEIVGNLLTDKDILQKKKDWISDMKTCDIPCRMTSNNVILQNYEKPKHIEFM
jgi:organic radical activating enzyme